MDMTVDSAALEEFDYYEDVEELEWTILYKILFLHFMG